MNNSRSEAYKILYSVFYEGAYSNIAINNTLRKSALGDLDRGFVTELVYGSIEKKIFLEYVLQRFSSMKLSKLAGEVRLILVMGLYQIRFMQSVTDFAAVDESVKLCKRVFPKGSGFVNGVLRSVLRDQNAFDIRIKDRLGALSVKYSVSKDIAALWVKQYGIREATRILEALSDRPRIYIRANSLRIKAAQLKERLNAEGIEARTVETEELALCVSGLKRIEENNDYRAGNFTVQDISSMAAVRLLAPQRGESVLDICAAPGGKTTFMAELMNNEGSIRAQDISQAKLKLVEGSCERLGIRIVETAAADATIFQEELVGRFDRVLVDAPCSGLGILRKKPEIRFKTSEQITALYDIQKKVLENAARYVKKGGILLYSTCTLNKKENEERLADFLGDSSFALEAEKLIMPYERDSDGFYIARTKRKN